MDARGLADQLRPLLGDDAIITDHQRLRTYECDGLTHHKVTPALVRAQALVVRDDRVDTQEGT